MRIIHTVPTINQEASGPTYSVVRLCESLIAGNLDVTLAALDWAPMTDSPGFLKTFPLGLGPRKLGRSPLMRRWLLDQAEACAADLIHNHSLWMMPNVYPGEIVRKSGTPLMLAPRGTLSRIAMKSGSSVKKLFWPLIQRPVLEAVTCFHATAFSEYEDIRRFGFRQPVAVIPNGIDMPAVTSRKPEDRRTLLFLGRIHPIKGLDMLLPAWRAVQDRFPDWMLRIVGPDNRGYLARMRELAVQLGVARVAFVGPLFGMDKFQAYADADLFVLPTYSENFGMAVAEALAAGTPAIVTRGAPWEGLPARGAGWWIDIGVDPLVAALEMALEQPRDRLACMGVKGQDWMRDEYSWERIGSRMARTYRWILGGGEKPEWVIEA